MRHHKLRIIPQIPQIISRINKHKWIAITVSIPIISISDRVFLYEATLCRIIITSPQINGLGFFVVIFAAITERFIVKSCLVILNAERIVRVTLCFASIRVCQRNYITVSIEVVICSVAIIGINEIDTSDVNAYI